MEELWQLIQPALDGLDALSLRLLPSERFGRVSVYYSCDAAEQATLSARLAVTFALLERRAPMWYRRVQQELGDIVVLPLGREAVGGWYDPARRVCSLNATPILEHNDALGSISAMFILVHETAHAWLNRHQVHLTGEAGRVREERICNRAEASLAARMPGELSAVVARRRAAIPERYSDPGLSAQRARLDNDPLSEIIRKLTGAG